MSRKIIDCRDHPSETKCSLTIAGEEEEVVKAATQHVVAVHGMKDNPETRAMIRQGLKDEPAEDGKPQPNVLWNDPETYNESFI